VIVDINIASNFLMSKKVDFCRNTDGFFVTVPHLLTKGVAYSWKQEKKRVVGHSLSQTACGGEDPLIK